MKLEEKLSVPKSKIYLWVDFSSMDQDNVSEIVKCVNALPLFVQCCDAFVTLEHDEYFNRAWCLIECRFAYQCHRSRAYPLMLQSQGDNINIIPHRCTSDLLYAAKVEASKVADAELSYESDRPTVRFLAAQATLL